MAGLLFDTLSRRVKLAIAQWRKGNYDANDLWYSGLWATVMRLAAKPLTFWLVVIGIGTVISVGIMVAPDAWLIPLPSFITSKVKDVAGHLTTVLATQATLVGLIYPIVIAFVSILLQRRYNPKAHLSVYLHDSIALFSGFGSLFLVALIAIQILLSAFREMYLGTIVSWLLIDGLWFLINLALTIVFLYRTIEFLKPIQRINVIRRYILNIMWSQEVANHVSTKMYRDAIEQVRNAVALTDLSKPVVKVERPSFKTSSSELRRGRVMSKPARLVDVRFNLLIWSIERWYKRAASMLEHGQGLHFAVEPGGIYQGPVVLCHVIGPTQLVSIERWAIRMSFKFRRKNYSKGLTVLDVFQDIKHEALAFLHIGELRSFEETVKEFVDTYVVIGQSSRITVMSDDRPNYVQLPSRDSVFGLPLYDEWLRPLAELCKEAALKMESHAEYYEEFLYIPGRLFRRLKNSVSLDVLFRFLHLQRALYSQLLFWWGITSEREGAVGHGICSPYSLKPPSGGSYAQILREFVGAWEHFAREEIRSVRYNATGSLAPQEYGNFLREHLQVTAEMVVMSATQGDRHGTWQSVDMLLQWISMVDDDRRGYIPDSDLIDSLNGELLFSGQLMSNADKSLPAWAISCDVTEMFNAIARNFWTDVCCVVAWTLLRAGVSCDTDSSLSVFVAKALIAGEMTDIDGKSMRIDRPVSNPNELLVSMLRQYFSDAAGEQYKVQMNSLAEKLIDRSKIGAGYIAGRIYSSIESDPLDSLRNAQLLGLMILVGNTWSPLTLIERTVIEIAKKYCDGIDIMLFVIDEWLKCLRHQDFQRNERQFDLMVGVLGQFQQARTVVQKGIGELRDKINELASNS